MRSPIIARRRRTTCRLFEPQLRISLNERSTKSSQFGVLKIRRNRPDRSRESPHCADVACQPSEAGDAAGRSRSTAVVGSLIAGDNAFRAISMTMRKANVGSCSSVLSDPIATIARNFASSPAAAPPYEIEQDIVGRNKIADLWHEFDDSVQFFGLGGRGPSDLSPEQFRIFRRARGRDPGHRACVDGFGSARGRYSARDRPR